MSELIFWLLALLWGVCVWRASTFVEKAFDNIAAIAEQSRYQSEMLKYIADLLYREVAAEDEEQEGSEA